MAGRYARNTYVSADKSQAELNDLLRRYGANQIASGWQTLPDGSERALIGFMMQGRQIRMHLDFPSMDSFNKTQSGRTRTVGTAQVKAYEQEKRRRWRVLVLLVKAQLEAIECNIVKFDDIFLGFTVLPGGQTAGEAASKHLEEFIKMGKIPALLPGSGEKGDEE